MSDTYISVDIGGTSTRIVGTTSLEKPNLQNKVSWVNSHDFETDYQKLIQEVAGQSSEIKAIGIGIPGDVREDQKTVYSTSWNQEWEEKPVVDLLSETFKCPVFLDNDGVVAALGVAHYGEGKDQDFNYLTWGTGIGGAKVRIKNGKVEATKIDWDIYFAMWEEKCGGRKLSERFGKAADSLTEGEWQLVMRDFESELQNFCQKLPIDVIIFGGGVSSKQSSRILDLNSPQLPKLKISSLGEDTGLYGGFGLIKAKS